jgi:hypothetical protein
LELHLTLLTLVPPPQLSELDSNFLSKYHLEIQARRPTENSTDILELQTS